MNKQPAKLPLFAVISIVFTIQLLLVSGFAAYTTYKTGRTSLIRSLLKSYHNHSINIDTEVQVEDQLHGSVKINRDKGTEFRITFSHTAGRKEEDG